MKKLFLAMVFAVCSTTLLAGNVSKPVMDPKVVVATMNEVTVSPKGIYIMLALIAIVAATSK